MVPTNAELAPTVALTRCSRKEGGIVTAVRCVSGKKRPQKMPRGCTTCLDWYDKSGRIPKIRPIPWSYLEIIVFKPWIWYDRIVPWTHKGEAV